MSGPSLSANSVKWLAWGFPASCRIAGVRKREEIVGGSLNTGLSCQRPLYKFHVQFSPHVFASQSPFGSFPQNQECSSSLFTTQFYCFRTTKPLHWGLACGRLCPSNSLRWVTPQFFVGQRQKNRRPGSQEFDWSTHPVDCEQSPWLSPAQEGGKERRDGVMRNN